MPVLDICCDDNPDCCPCAPPITCPSCGRDLPEILYATFFNDTCSCTPSGTMSLTYTAAVTGGLCGVGSVWVGTGTWCGRNIRLAFACPCLWVNCQPLPLERQMDVCIEFLDCPGLVETIAVTTNYSCNPLLLEFVMSCMFDTPGSCVAEFGSWRIRIED